MKVFAAWKHKQICPSATTIFTYFHGKEITINEDVGQSFIWASFHTEIACRRWSFSCLTADYLCSCSGKKEEVGQWQFKGLSPFDIASFSRLQKYLLVLTTGLISSVWPGLFFPRCTVLVLFRCLDDYAANKKKRLSKPLWSTGSHHRTDPNDCSRLAHIWGLNETNDLRQTTGELFLHPQYAWKLPEQLSFHRTTTFIHTTDVGNCEQSVGFFGIFCPGNVVGWSFRQMVQMLFRSHFGTSLKLSNAERMISWPPRTRQTAASSSRTNAFVLQTQEPQVQST